MKPPKIPSLISIIILTAITIVFWILFEVLRVFIAKPATNVPESITQPLNPSIDTNTLNKMEKSIYIEKNP